MKSLTLHQVNKQTMSSRVIADLVGKRHCDVMRDIREMFKQLDENANLRSAYYVSNNRDYLEYQLNRRECEILVTGYDVKRRAAVIDRWMELEQLSVPSTYSEALRLAADQAALIERQERDLLLAAPKVEFVERYCDEAEGNKGFRQVCKLLKANENRFREFLFANKIMYRLEGVLTAHQNHIDAGRFHVTTGIGANDHAFTSCKFTPKGIEWVAQLWNEE